MIDYPRKNWKHKRTRKKAPLSQIIKRSIISLIVTLTIINGFLLILFLMHNSENSQKGYALKLTQEQNEDLQFKQKILQAKLIELQKLDHIDSNNIVKKMEAATEEAYQYLE